MIQTTSILALGLLLVCTVMCQDTNQPLHLTPYLQRGEIATARNLSSVSYRNGSMATSYAGFLTTDPILGNHLFFWFFPALNSDPKSPVVVWMNGGPGVPSMLGLFHENGPLRLQTQGDGSFSLKIWNLTWADQFSMLYIDNPVGVGYSYSDSGEKSYRTTQDGYTKDLYEFIQQFYTMFPEYMRRELYIGGQSYAGKFVTSLAHKIHTQIVSKKSAIPLTGIYLGAPFLDPFSQSRAMGNFFYSTGAISQRQLRDHQILVDEVFSGLRLRQMTADEAMGMLLLNNTITGLWSDNYMTGTTAPYEELWYLMNMAVMKELVHVENVTFQTGSDDFRSKYSQDRLRGVRSELAVLLNSYKVLIYNGDLDAVVSSAMVDAALLSTNWSLKDQYRDSVREVWSNGFDLKGFYTRTGQFCRVVIHGAGHQAPFDQPEISLDMMTQFINYGCIHIQTV